ncbi:MAG: dipeptide ABC transporter ATP-binding protein [Anaerolineales bacterium]
MERLLQVENLWITYHTREARLSAVRNVDFSVERGKIVGLVGESGCGKSSIALALMRLLPPNGVVSNGKIIFQGQNLLDLSENEMRAVRGHRISMIFQDPMTSLNPVFSIEQQMVDAILARAPQNQKPSRSAARQEAIAMLERVGIPDAFHRIHDYPHQFSGGMRQRIMIALALQSNPALLIADEPTSALDVTLEAQITELIRSLRDELQTSILYITHDLGIVAQLCDEVIVLYAGNIVETGDVWSLFKKPRHPYTQALLRSHPTYETNTRFLATIPGRVPSLSNLPPGCKFAPRCPFAQDRCHQEDPLAVEIEGQKVCCHIYQPDWRFPAKTATPAPALENLEKSEFGEGYREKTTPIVKGAKVEVNFQEQIGLLSNLLGQKSIPLKAVRGIDIMVYRGETLAVVGESGSGKTTLGRTILGLENATSGEIVVDGKSLSEVNPGQKRAMRAKMQMIFQDPISSLSPRKTVSELLLEPFRIHNIAVNPQDKVAELLEMVGLSTEQANKYPHQLSGGQARRVGIARALALNPALLVADEPTAGLDVSVAAGILNLMKELREKFGLTYILITHNLNVVRFVADRVAVMYLGQIVEIGDAETIFSQPKHPYTEALISAIAIPDPEIRRTRKQIILEGEIPDPRHPPAGCPFHPRCRYQQERCTIETPTLTELREGHRSACFFPQLVSSM